MGVYENIINSKKKKDEEESLYDRITGENTTAKDNYEEQKNILKKVQKEYSKALNEEYKNTGAFDFSIPSRLQQNEFSNKIVPNAKTTQTTNNPFDTKQTLERIKTAQNNVKDLKTTVDEEYNKLKYDRYLKDIEKVGNEETDLWDKTGGTFIRALKGSLSSIGMDKYTYIDEEGNKVYLPTYDDIKQQKVSQDYDTKIGKFLGDTAYNTTKILGSTAVNSLAPGVGSFMYWQDMYMDNYKSSVNQGYDDIRSSAYALTSTGLEYLTGKFLGSATKGLTGGKSNELSNTLSNATMRLTNNPTISRILGNAGSEATEEFVQEYLDNINRLVTLENSTDIGDYISIFTDSKIMEDALYSAGVGALSGGFISGTDINSNKNTNKNIQMFKEFKTQLEEAKKTTTNVAKVEQYDNAINKINEYLNKPFTNNEISLPKIETTNPEVNVQQNLEKLSTKNNINLPKTANIDSDIFSRQVDEVVNGTFPKKDMLTISQETPQVLQNLGLQNFPITMTQKHLDTIMNREGKYGGANYHDLGIDIVKQLPRAIAEPLNVLKSSTKDDSIVVVTDLSDKNDNIVIASIAIDGKGKINDITIDSNVMTSAYGKNNYDVWMQKNKENIIYDIDEDTKKGDSTRIQYPRSTTPFLNDNNTTNSAESQIVPSPSQYSMQQNTENDTKIPTYNDLKKVMNPNEISKLTKEDSSSTPIIPNYKAITGEGESKFYSNVTEKSKYLNEGVRKLLENEDDIKYYKEITNKDTLEEAYTKLQLGGESETISWFQRNGYDENGKFKYKPTAVDVAEGWILMKQYQDAKNYDGVVAVAKKMREIGTQAGQTVQAFGIMQRLTPEGMVKYAQSELSEAFDQMSKNKTKEWIDSNRDKFDLNPQEVQAIVEIMEKVQTMEDGYDKKVELAKIQKIMTDKLPPSKGAGIKAWMRISMLFNPKTQVRNVMGNAVIAPVNYFSDLFSSAVDRMVSKKTGYRTTGITNIGSYVKGFGKGAVESYNDFKKGINTRNIEGNRFEIKEGKSFNSNTSIGKALNKVDSLLGFMLDAGDRTFYEATFTNSINNQMKLNKTNEVTQEMIDIATQEALSRTWQDNNNYTKFVLNVRKMMNVLNFKGYGLGDVLVPFAKTPANLTKAIVDYSPLGLIQTINDGVNLKRSLTNGQYNPQMQHKFVQDLGKATAGTMLYAIGYALAKAGITSGESDDDKDVANFMKNTLGVSSYSIKIGDKTFTYDWAQPIAAPLSITANIVKNQKEGANLYENIMSSLNTAGSILLEQSFLDSLNTVFSNNEGIVTGLQEAVLELPSRAIPTFMKQITDLTDGTQRTTFEKDKPLETALNKIKAKIPGLSQTLAPTKDTLGRDVKKYGGKNNIFNVFINPANVNTENISKSAEEIYRVYKATGEKSVMPRVPEYKYKDENGNEIILNSKQRAEYQEVSGQIVEDNVEKLLKTTEYKNLTDTEKAEILNNIVNYSYNVAKKEVLGLEISQTYEKAYEYSEIGNISDYYTFKANIDDTDSDTKKESISNYLINSNLNNKQLAYLYGGYYSSEETLNSLLNANIPIKEFIKFNSQEFESDFNTKTGKTVSGSRQKKVMDYINGLNLSVPQKALLIKMEFKSYDKYDRQIAEYVNSQNISFLDKARILKKANFTSFDKQIINYVNSQNMTIAEKTEILEELGFTVRNGRVY